MLANHDRLTARDVDEIRDDLLRHLGYPVRPEVVARLRGGLDALVEEIRRLRADVGQGLRPCHKDVPCDEFFCLPEVHPDHYEMRLVDPEVELPEET